MSGLRLAVCGISPDWCRVFGSSNPATDVEMIAMAAQFFKDIGITNVSLELNSLGNPESRAAYRQALIDYLTPLKPSLSADSQRRLRRIRCACWILKSPRTRRL